MIDWDRVRELESKGYDAVGTSCDSHHAVFRRECPYCKNVVESLGAEDYGLDGVTYCVVCHRCRTVFYYNTRKAWESDLRCR